MAADRAPDPAPQPLPEALAAPARRALAAAGIERLEQLAALPERDVAAWHGIGPNALRVLRAALDDAGLSFASPARSTQG
jgi:hypothetical protein